MLPELFIARMQTLLKDEYPAFAAAYDLPRNVGLRINPLRQASLDLSAFSLSPVPWCPTGFYYDPTTRPGLSPYHEAGAYYLQEPSAMAPVELLEIQPGERVLDLCAAPGGKTTQIAGKLNGQGLLVCNEIHPKRAAILSQNLERLGVANALCLCEHPKKLEERFTCFFDKILVDAPCSGEGMFRKETAAVTDWSEETVLMCAKRQQEILKSAAAMLRPGGRLVYSTCTFSPQENEGSIAAFLHENPDFFTKKISAPWFSPGRPDWVLNAPDCIKDTFRLWPHKLRGEGHFAAVLQKRKGGRMWDGNFEKTTPLSKEVRAFAVDLGAEVPYDACLSFGDHLYVVPPELPRLQGLKVLRVGLELAEQKKGRLEPAHAWSHWLKTAESIADFPANSDEIRRYLAGEAIPGSETGWTLVCADGLPLGWAKGSGGMLKNHYPKGLRRVSGAAHE